jgi:hypothetical protein
MARQVQTGTLQELTERLERETVSTCYIVKVLGAGGYGYSSYKAFADGVTRPDSQDGSFEGSRCTRYLGAMSAAADVPSINNLLTYPLLNNINPRKAIRMMLNDCKEEKGHAFGMFIQYCEESGINISQL